ncbi:MAG TPA: MFS transporter [Steroidobacteraceae bacterium]|nr:MFS transporter [Steroidobacteraceae bacterium]
MWLRKTTPRERHTLLAAGLGYGLDGFDFMVYTFVIPTLLVAWHLTKAQAGYIATGSLLTSAVGGWAAGVLADRHGRVRVLQWTVAWFAAFTCMSGFTHSYEGLFFTRAMQGFGFGGEWAVGSVLIAESIEALHRGKAAGIVQSGWAIGWAAAALAYGGLYTLLPAALAWRALFWLGIAPALLIVYIRRRVPESPLYEAARGHAAGTPFLDIFAPPLRVTTWLASLLCTGMLGAYYAVNTWLPTYLSRERHLSVVGTSGYLLVLIAGSLSGYLVAAWACDALGRRRSFIVFAACGALLVLAYTRLQVSDAEMLALGFPLGFFQSGIFSGMGAFLAELYPQAVRGSGQGFSYSSGRAVGALFPAAIGVWSAHAPLAGCIGAVTAVGYGLVIAAALALPETRGRILIA